MLDSKRLFSMPLAGSIGTAALCFVAVIAGIVAGNALIKPGNTVLRERPVAGKDLPRMILAPGDLFPYEPLRYAEGTSGNFEDLLGDQNALLYFVEPHCKPCNNILKFRRDSMRERLLPGVKEIIVIPDSYESIPDEFAGFFEGAKVVYYDRQHWERTYHQVMWPTVVGVDESGFIIHIQYGYENAVDYELVTRFFASVE